MEYGYIPGVIMYVKQRTGLHHIVQVLMGFMNIIRHRFRFATDTRRLSRSPMALACLVGLIFMTFGSTMSNGFIYITDDETNILRYHHDLLRTWTESFEQMYIPVTYTAWIGLGNISSMIFGGLHPALFHGASLLVHIVNTFLVWKIACRFHTIASPLLAAAFFAFHPLQVESVAWVTEFRGLLGAMFLLMSIDAFCDDKPSSIFWFVMSILSKNSMIIGVAIFPILFFVRGRLWVTGVNVVVGVVAAVLLYGLQNSGVGAVNPQPLNTLGHYAMKMVFPMIGEISVDYGHSQDAGIWFAGIVWCMWAFYKPFHWMALITIVPVLGFFSIRFFNWSFAADRYMYLPLTFVGASFAATNVRWWKFAIVAVMAIVSFNRVPVWENEISLYSDAVSNPRNFRNRPVSLMVLGMAAEREGESETALYYYEASRQSTERVGVRNQKAADGIRRVYRM